MNATVAAAPAAERSPAASGPPLAAYAGAACCAALGISAVLPWISGLGEGAKGADIPIGILLNKEDPALGIGWVALGLAAVGLLGSLTAPRSRTIGALLSFLGGVALALVGGFAARLYDLMVEGSLFALLGVGTYVAGAGALGMIIFGAALRRSG